MQTLSSVLSSAVVEAHVELEGITAEILSYDWGYSDPFDYTLKDKYCFVQTLQMQHPQEEPMLRLPTSGNFFRGRSFVTPPNRPVHFHQPEGGVRILTCTIPEERAQRLAALPGDWYNDDFLMRLNERRVSPFRFMDTIAEELNHPRHASGEMLESISTCFLIEFGRLARANDVECVKRNYAHWQSGQVCKMIDEMPLTQISIDALAAACGVSARKLMRDFKAEMGCTVHHYIEEVRLRRTKDMLRNTTMQLKVVAADAGFCSPSHFSSNFMKSTGVRPSVYRAMGKIEQHSSSSATA